MGLAPQLQLSFRFRTLLPSLSILYLALSKPQNTMSDRAQSTDVDSVVHKLEALLQASVPSETLNTALLDLCTLPGYILEYVLSGSCFVAVGVSLRGLSQAISRNIRRKLRRVMDPHSTHIPPDGGRIQRQPCLKADLETTYVSER